VLLWFLTAKTQNHFFWVPVRMRTVLSELKKSRAVLYKIMIIELVTKCHMLIKTAKSEINEMFKSGRKY